MSAIPPHPFISTARAFACFSASYINVSNNRIGDTNPVLYL